MLHAAIRILSVLPLWKKVAWKSVPIRSHLIIQNLQGWIFEFSSLMLWIKDWSHPFVFHMAPSPRDKRKCHLVNPEAVVNLPSLLLLLDLEELWGGKHRQLGQLGDRHDSLNIECDQHIVSSFTTTRVRLLGSFIGMATINTKSARSPPMRRADNDTSTHVQAGWRAWAPWRRWPWPGRAPERPFSQCSAQTWLCKWKTMVSYKGPIFRSHASD